MSERTERVEYYVQMVGRALSDEWRDSGGACNSEEGARHGVAFNESQYPSLKFRAVKRTIVEEVL
jgi:hypothetical protein